MTYNHKPYILDALNGFAMQQTNFPFVAFVMDDASTDGEPEVLRQYISEQCDAASMTTKDDELYELIEIKAKDNSNCHFAFYFLKQNLWRTDKKKTIIAEWDAQAKYIAICEGDDYWTDPYKLQKQVDFLESHPDFSMCFHKVEVLSYNESRDSSLYDHLEEREYTAREIYDKWTIPTCSEMHRANIHIPPTPKGFPFGDIYYYLNLLHRGRGYCLGFVGGVYRRLSSGVSSQSNTTMYVRLIHQYEQMLQMFPELQDITLRNIELYRKELAANHVFKGSYKYRFQKMKQNPRLIYRPYMLKTLFWHIMKLNKDIIIEL